MHIRFWLRYRKWRCVFEIDFLRQLMSCEFKKFDNNTRCIYCCFIEDFPINFDIRPHPTCASCFHQQQTTRWVIVPWGRILQDFLIISLWDKKIKRSKWTRFWRRFFMRCGKMYLQREYSETIFYKWEYLCITKQQYKRSLKKFLTDDEIKKLENV
jgi:hypothetical protein